MIKTTKDYFNSTRELYTTILDPITPLEVQQYCAAARLPIDKYYKQGELYRIPGDYMVILLRHAIEKMTEEERQFGVSKIDYLTISCDCKQEEESITLSDEKLLFGAQIYGTITEKLYVRTNCRAAISRSSNEHIIFCGLFIFFQKIPN